VAPVGIRFTRGPLNTLVVTLGAIGLPILALAGAPRIRRFGPRWAVALVGVVTLGLGLLFAGWVLFAWGDPRRLLGAADPELERIHEWPVPPYFVSVYRTADQGALGGTGVLVRQEWEPVPGLRLVRNRGGIYPSDDVAIEMPASDSVRIFDGARVVAFRLWPTWHRP
jgi:MFS family permease